MACVCHPSYDFNQIAPGIKEANQEISELHHNWPPLTPLREAGIPGLDSEEFERTKEKADKYIGQVIAE